MDFFAFFNIKSSENKKDNKPENKQIDILYMDNHDIVKEHEHSFHKLQQSYIDKINSYKERYEKLEEENNKLKSLLCSEYDLHKQTKEERDKLKIKNTTLHNDFDNMKQKNNLLHMGIVKEVENNKKLKQDIEMNMILLSDKNMEFVQLQKENKEIKDRSKNRYWEIMAENNNLTLSNEQNKHIIANYVETIGNQRNELHKINSSNSSLKINFNKLIVENNKLQEETIKLKAEMGHYISQIKNISEENRVLEKEQEELTDIIKMDCINNKKRELEIETLRSELSKSNILN